MGASSHRHRPTSTPTYLTMYNLLIFNEVFQFIYDLHARAPLAHAPLAHARAVRHAESSRGPLPIGVQDMHKSQSNWQLPGQPPVGQKKKSPLGCDTTPSINTCLTTPATIEPLALRVLAAATAAEARVATVMAAAVSSSVGVVQVVVPEGDSNRRCSACPMDTSEHRRITRSRVKHRWSHYRRTAPARPAPRRAPAA